MMGDKQHAHTHTQTKNVINRLSRIIGHAEGIKKMYEEGKDCSDIIIQISAVKSALNNVGKIILKDHIDHCIIDAIENGDESAIENLHHAIDKMMK